MITLINFDELHVSYNKEEFLELNIHGRRVLCQNV